MDGKFRSFGLSQTADMPSSSTRLLTLPELAEWLGIPILTLRRTIGGMRANNGFPQPVPGSGGRYDPIAITAWRRRLAGLEADTERAVTRQASPVTAPADDESSEWWQNELDSRSAFLGADTSPAGHKRTKK